MNYEITVKLFAPFSDAVGARQVTLRIPGAVTTPELLRLLGEQYPPLAPYLAEDRPHDEAILLIVNGHMTSSEDEVRPGDNVFLCPQISGG
ncbi:MAG: MoaD/ThiS family protein [Chloroflexota bacterium]